MFFQTLIREPRLNPDPPHWINLHKTGPGRPVQYNPEWDLKALILRQLEQIPDLRDLVKRLRRERSLREACGLHDTVPSELTSPR